MYYTCSQDASVVCKMFHLLLDRGTTLQMNEIALDEPSRKHPLEETMYTCNNTDIYSNNKSSKGDFSKRQTKNRLRPQQMRR